MAQQQNARGGGSDRLWLEALIDSFETASRDQAPCDRALLSATEHYLARPAEADASQTSNIRFNVLVAAEA